MTNKRAVIALFMGLTACEGGDKGPDQWDAFIYPNKSALTIDEEIKGFKTFELCQQPL